MQMWPRFGEFEVFHRIHCSLQYLKIVFKNIQSVKQLEEQRPEFVEQVVIGKQEFENFELFELLEQLIWLIMVGFFVVKKSEIELVEFERLQVEVQCSQFEAELFVIVRPGFELVKKFEIELLEEEMFEIVKFEIRQLVELLIVEIAVMNSIRRLLVELQRAVQYLY